MLRFFWGGGLLEKCLFLKFLIRGFGACVAARDCYTDSYAQTLIKIGGILIIVFVICSLDFVWDPS